MNSRQKYHSVTISESPNDKDLDEIIQQDEQMIDSFLDLLVKKSPSKSSKILLQDHEENGDVSYENSS